ncbi:MAG: hypothetical protein R3240_01415 [Gammaproteobacteria bacterium]|nr:hypothetical protein [Gammaproteobacteria bacterium]
MHPLIVLVCFILFAGFVSLGSGALLAAGLFLLVVSGLLLRTGPGARAWRMLSKMRLFFLSIFILYVWFTPGELLFFALDHWSPTWEGLTFGGERVLALVLLVLAVDMLLKTLSREQILCGLFYCFYPLTLLGFSRDKFMIRTWLTLEAVTSHPVAKPPRKSFDLKHFPAYIDALAGRIRDLLEQANAKACEEEIIIEIEGPPIWYHWLLPIGVLIYFSGISLW